MARYARGMIESSELFLSFFLMYLQLRSRTNEQEVGGVRTSNHSLLSPVLNVRALYYRPNLT